MAKGHRYFVYIMAGRRNGTLYVGVTSNLAGRTWQHRTAFLEGFTRKYGVHMLVWFEEWGDIREAILRETRIKKWRRVWKSKLIEDFNPDREGLFPRIV